MSGRMEGKVALVTGAGTGIGRATCVRLAEEGAEVVVTSRTAANVEADLRRRRARGRDAAARAFSSTWPTARPSTRPASRRRSGTGASTCWWPTPASSCPITPNIADTSDEDWERIMRVNVTGMFYAIRAALRHMPDGGAIVTVGSINSFVAWENDGAYTTSKGAVLQLTRSVALDVVDRNIRANCICPGVIDTPLTDQFLADAEDADALQGRVRRGGADGPPRHRRVRSPTASCSWPPTRPAS